MWSQWGTGSPQREAVEGDSLSAFRAEIPPRPKVGIQHVLRRPWAGLGEGAEGQAGLEIGAAPGARVFLREHGGQMGA